MKKLILIAAVALVGFASCTNEEDVLSTVAQKEISFKAVAGKNTRGVVTGTVF